MLSDHNIHSLTGTSGLHWLQQKMCWARRDITLRLMKTLLSSSWWQ
jgi:hypothetical protein